MGYNTDFFGSLKFNKPLTPDQVAYINRFSGSRRMKRDPKIAEKFPDPLRVVLGLPIGDEGAYFVGSDKMDGEIVQPGDPRYLSPEEMKQRHGWAENGPVSAGQRHDSSVLEYNFPPRGQPGLWCQWVVTEDGTELEWDEGEKFYEYVEWLEYLIKHFFEKWGVKLNGEIGWKGSEDDDRGTIFVKNNKVEAVLDKIVQGKPSWEK